MIKAVIVDFDDTLCLTEEACFYLENAVLEQMGRAPMNREIHLKTWGQPLFEAIKVRSPGIDAEEFRRLLPAMHREWIADERIDKVSMESLQALDAVLEQGKDVYILTSRTEVEIKHLLAPDHHLATRVKDMYHRDNMEFHKPDPRAFDRLLQEHHLKPQECVYVGDSITDAQAAKEAGLHFIASLESGLRKKEDFSPPNVDAFISAFADLPDAVAQIEKLTVSL